MHRAILTGQAIDQWRFDTVRADYQAILKRSGDNPAVEEALRIRLIRVTRHEQAAAAAGVPGDPGPHPHRDGQVA